MRNSMAELSIATSTIAIFVITQVKLSTSQSLNRDGFYPVISAEELRGVADFRSVRLSWKCNSTLRPAGFAVEYCELVSWGKAKCISRFVNRTDIAPLDANLVDAAATPRTYETVIRDLQMATNYSFDVQPVVEGWSPAAARGRSLKRNDIIVSTKGFAASPRSCLGDRSEIDVETGPFFGGRISVEGSEDKRCAWIGDPRDPSIIHTFTIDHAICGGNKKIDRMENIIIVTESRSIITHTARRFMVVCNLLPETYTIKASINIPSNAVSSRSNVAIPENKLNSASRPEEKFHIAKHPDSNMISSRRTAELEQVAHLFADNQKETTMAHLVLMVILVVAAAIGVTATVWWFIGGARHKKMAIADLKPPNIVTGDDNSDDRKLVFVVNKDEEEEEIGDFQGFDTDYSPAIEQSECTTTFVLAPSMNMAFRSLGAQVDTPEDKHYQTPEEGSTWAREISRNFT